MQKSMFSTRKLVIIALLAAVSTLLMYIEVPLPFMPPFLKLDISAAPIMIGSFMFGPLAGVCMAGVKALVHLCSTQTAGVGELADFIMTASFALSAGLVYRFHKTKKGAAAACASGVAAIAAAGCLANWFILLPFYQTAMGMPLDAILAMCSAVNPYINSAAAYILIGVLPFNIIKGVIVCLLTFLLYKRLSVVIHRYTDAAPKAKNAVDKQR